MHIEKNLFEDAVTANVVVFDISDGEVSVEEVMDLARRNNAISSDGKAWFTYAIAPQMFCGYTEQDLRGIKNFSFPPGY